MQVAAAALLFYLSCDKRQRRCFFCQHAFFFFLEEKGFRLCAMKMTTASKDLLEMHFADLISKPYFPKLVEFMLSGPVVAMVWEGKGAVKTDRKMLGETNPVDSLPGTIRGDYCIDIGRNICHGSDSVETAKKEIALWFKEGELNNYCCANNSWVYE